MFEVSAPVTIESSLTAAPCSRPIRISIYFKKHQNREKRPFSKEIANFALAETIFSLAFTISATEIQSKSTSVERKSTGAKSKSISL